MHTLMHSYRPTNALQRIWQMPPPPPEHSRPCYEQCCCFIIILFHNWNGIHWLTNYPFCFTYHTQNNVEFLIHLNSTVSHSGSDAQQPSGWPQDRLYSDVLGGKTLRFFSSVYFILFPLSCWCQTRPFCADFKIPYGGITLIWLKRLTAVYFSSSGNHSNYITDEKRHGCSEIVEVWAGGLGSLRGTISTMDSARDIYTVKKMLLVLHSNIGDNGQFSAASPILCSVLLCFCPQLPS